MSTSENSKVIPSVLLDVHETWSPAFWIKHDIDNCSDCQEALKK